MDTMTYKTIDQSKWSRREHYSFFGQMPDPFFGLAAKVDFTDCYEEARRDGASFFLYSLHRIMKAVNSVPELRCRIVGDEVVCYDRIAVSPTIGREDVTFGFAYLEYYDDRQEFVAGAQKEIERVKSGTGLSMDDNEQRLDVLYFSAIPWVDFTQVKPEGGHRPGDSIPQIITGKLVEEDGRRRMNVYIEANHGLADGLHVGMFFRNI